MTGLGYFPSKYVTKLHPGEKPLQVTHNLQVTDGAENGLKLLRDQVIKDKNKIGCYYYSKNVEIGS